MMLNTLNEKVNVRVMMMLMVLMMAMMKIMMFFSKWPNQNTCSMNVELVEFRRCVLFVECGGVDNTTT
jgi:hypothetical protein